MQSNTLEIRKLIDDVFALQWCRENIVVPIGVEQDNQSNAQKLIIAIVGAERLGGGDILKTWRESAICV